MTTLSHAHWRQREACCLASLPSCTATPTSAGGASGVVPAVAHCPVAAVLVHPLSGHPQSCVPDCGDTNRRNIIAPNDAFEPDKVDSRGYVPCEYWVASMTTAGNPIAKKGEGVTKMQLLGCDSVGLDELNVSHGALLFGEYGARWPLTKVRACAAGRVGTGIGVGLQRLRDFAA